MTVVTLQHGIDCQPASRQSANQLLIPLGETDTQTRDMRTQELIIIFVENTALLKQIRKLSRRPAHRPATQHMQMYMKHGLPGTAIAVHHRAVAAVGYAFIFGDLFGGQIHIAN